MSQQRSTLCNRIMINSSVFIINWYCESWKYVTLLEMNITWECVVYATYPLQKILYTFFRIRQWRKVIWRLLSMLPAVQSNVVDAAYFPLRLLATSFHNDFLHAFWLLFLNYHNLVDARFAVIGGLYIRNLSERTKWHEVCSGSSKMN